MIILSNLINKDTMINIMNNLDLDNMLVVNKNYSNFFCNNPDNFLEVLISAIYLDSNITTIFYIIEYLWNDYIYKLNIYDKSNKTMIYEMFKKKYNVLPIFIFNKYFCLEKYSLFISKLYIKNIGKLISISSKKKKSEFYSSIHLVNFL